MIVTAVLLCCGICALSYFRTVGCVPPGVGLAGGTAQGVFAIARQAFGASEHPREALRPPTYASPEFIPMKQLTLPTIREVDEDFDFDLEDETRF